MYLSIFKPSQTPKYSAIWWMLLCYESAGFLSWNLFFCVFEICRAAFYRNTPQAELAFIRKGKKKWKVLSQKPNYTLFNQPSNHTRNRPILWSHSAVNADLRDFYSRTTTLPLFLQIWNRWATAQPVFEQIVEFGRDLSRQSTAESTTQWWSDGSWGG